MSTTKKINEAAKLTNVPASSLIAVASATGQLTPVSYSDLLAQLRNDLLGGRQVGTRAGFIPEIYQFPARTTLISQGYMENTTDSEPYFKAVILWFMDNTPNEVPRDLFGVATPNTSGITLLHIYSGGKNAEGFPASCCGCHIRLAGEIVAFGTNNGKYYYKVIRPSLNKHPPAIAVGGRKTSIIHNRKK